MRNFDVPNRHNYADRHNPIAHVTKAAGFEIRPFDWLDFKRNHPTKTLAQ